MRPTEQHSSFPFSFIKGVILPILGWIAFIPWSAELDLKLSHAFYHEGAFSAAPFWNWIYIYALWPGWILTAIAFIGVVFSFKKAYHSWRIPCLYLLLTLGIGSGLIIQAVLKDHWGRPRPRQVTEFGGELAFRPFYKPNFEEIKKGTKSFSCGHASLGYYFFALAILGGIYHSPFFYWLGLALGWGLGILLSVARIAQGGHFLSDTITSALIMWLTAWFLAYWLFAYKKQRNQPLVISGEHENLNS